MSNDLAVSMDELERESAELLPSRETLCCARPANGGGNIFSQVAGGGDTISNGLINIPILDGNAINIAL
jgi:hypothetical protein